MDFKELGANLGLEEDEYRELIELFVQSGGIDLKNLQEALATGDGDRVMRSAHTIRGASGNLGLSDVSEVAQLIEERAQRNRLDDLQPSVQLLKTRFAEIRALI